MPKKKQDKHSRVKVSDVCVSQGLIVTRLDVMFQSVGVFGAGLGLRAHPLSLHDPLPPFLALEGSWVGLWDL